MVVLSYQELHIRAYDQDGHIVIMDLKILVFFYWKKISLFV